MDPALAREVLRLRIAMLLINELIRRRTFSVPIHLAFGHEAIAVAVAAIMRPADRLLLTHRNIHYNLARNPSLRREIDEYLLRETGLAGGREGAMNLTNPEAGIVYTSSVLANCLPVATGIAMGRKLAGGDAVTIAVTGDGAMEEGAFYETLVMANSLSLPLMIVVENNEWSMHTRIEERRCAIGLQEMAAAFSMDVHRLTGNDPLHYRRVLTATRHKAVATGRPAIVEVQLATLGGYTVEDDAAPGGRFVNYHHGAAPHVSVDDGPLIEASERDPVHVIARSIAEPQFAEWSRRIRSELERDLP